MFFNAALSRLQFLRNFLQIDKLCSSTHCFVWDCKPVFGSYLPSKMAAEKTGKPLKSKSLVTLETDPATVPPRSVFHSLLYGYISRLNRIFWSAGVPGGGVGSIITASFVDSIPYYQKKPLSASVEVMIMKT